MTKQKFTCMICGKKTTNGMWWPTALPVETEVMVCAECGDALILMVAKRAEGMRLRARKKGKS